MLTALLMVALLLYVVGYFWASRAVVSEPLRLVKVRIFSAEWQVSIYKPLAKVEESFIGIEVLLETD
jgi:hypothetical protein